MAAALGSASRTIGSVATGSSCSFSITAAVPGSGEALEVDGLGGAVSGSTASFVVSDDSVLVGVVAVLLLLLPVPPPARAPIEKNFTNRFPAVPLVGVVVVVVVPDATAGVVILLSSVPEGLVGLWDDDDNCLLRNFLTRLSGTFHWGLCSKREECTSFVVAGVLFSY